MSNLVLLFRHQKHADKKHQVIRKSPKVVIDVNQGSEGLKQMIVHCHFLLDFYLKFPDFAENFLLLLKIS